MKSFRLYVNAVIISWRLSRWSKASKCKELLKTVIRRVKLLQNKRRAQIKQFRDDIAQIVRSGRDQHQSWFYRVDLLFKEQNLVEGYNMIEMFCESVLGRFSYMRTHNDLPFDIKEAVSSLIFAAARCADLPELQRLRQHFADRYGHEFATAALDLLPDSSVNKQIIEKFSDNLSTLDIKLKLMESITEEYKIQWDSSAMRAEGGNSRGSVGSHA